MHKTILIFIEFFSSAERRRRGRGRVGTGLPRSWPPPGPRNPRAPRCRWGTQSAGSGIAEPCRAVRGRALPSRAEPVPAASPGRCRSALPSVPGSGRAPAAAGPGPGFSAAIGSRGWPGPRVSRGGPRGSPAGREGPPAGTARAGVPQPRGEPPGAAGARGGPAAPGSRDPVLGQGQI